jgi:hypothetical protein
MIEVYFGVTMNEAKNAEECPTFRGKSKSCKKPLVLKKLNLGRKVKL